MSNIRQTLFLLIACLSFYPTNCSVAQIKLLDKNGRFQLEKDGHEFSVCGVGGTGNLELLKELGGNSIRTWGTKGRALQKILDEAERLDLAVCVGIWLEHERHGFDYGDKQAVTKQFERSIEIVKQFKDHPAVLLWGIGNEMEGDGKKSAIWQAVDQIAARVKQIDPDHPTITVINELGEQAAKLKSIQQFCPNIDIVGVNSYGGMLTLAQRYRQSGIRKPYIVTEHGPKGPWEVNKTAWGSAMEDSNADKAKLYKIGYQSTAVDHKDLCLGTYAFLWGHKQETTATWFGMLLPDGSRLQAADTMSKLWTGKSVRNRCPIIREVRLNKTSGIIPGESLTATVKTADPERDRLKVVWKLRRDSQTIGEGGDFQDSIPDIDSVISSKGRRAVIKIPDEESSYRLFVYVYDGKGGADVRNVCLNVSSRK